MSFLGKATKAGFQEGATQQAADDGSAEIKAAVLLHPVGLLLEVSCMNALPTVQTLLFFRVHETSAQGTTQFAQKLNKPARGACDLLACKLLPESQKPPAFAGLTPDGQHGDSLPRAT
jgi:hypothetical protein